jgi:glutamyl-tRNA synthetase
MHLGNARTALFNYLFARRHDGTMILRVEDTDRERSTDEARQVIFDSLQWLGIQWDEGPYSQSERIDLHRAGIEKLLSEGKAYRCACSAEELQAKREAAQAAKETYRYDGKCRDANVPADVPHTIRARFPKEGKTVVRDLLREPVEFDNAEYDDIIIARTDGSPTYNFVVVIDDADMEITHVLRGDDHLYNTPKQIMLYDLLGKPIPEFAHFPMLLGPDGSKLSKRHGASSVLELRDQGFLPEVLMSFLARLGWSHGDQEEFTKDELTSLFDVKDVRTTAGVFDVEKLTHFNGKYIREADPTVLAGLVRPFLTERGFDPDVPWLARAIESLKVRSTTLVELTDGLAPFFAEEVVFDEKSKKKHLKPSKAALLPSLADALDAVDEFTAEKLEVAAEEWLTANETALKKIGQPIRVSLTGRAVSPPLFDTMETSTRWRSSVGRRPWTA